MVVVEPIVSGEKLFQLLAEQAESAALDFKSGCDLRRKADQVELAKDVGAMQMHGGYVVVGADDHGRPTDNVDRDSTRLFDEARLRSKLRRWLAEPISLLSATHEVDGHSLVLVYVGPTPLGFAVFQADGQYEVNGQLVTAFRKGDVFARHGSASEPWSQSDLPAVFDRVVETRKDEWRRDLSLEFSRLDDNVTARRLAVAPAAALTWNLDAASFDSVIIEQMRAGDDIPVRLLLERLPSEAMKLAQSEEGFQELNTLFDRLAAVISMGLRLNRGFAYDLGLRASGLIYDAAVQGNGHPAGWQVSQPEYCLTFIERIVGLGGLAVRRERWDEVRTLALHPVEYPNGYRWRSWIRHALTTAARSGLFKETINGQQVERSLLSLAHRAAEERAFLRPDLLPGDERLLDSLCQFDALAALAVMSEVDGAPWDDFYPSFARFYTHRTEPIVARLLAETTLRRAIYPQSDDHLARSLRQLNRFAVRESLRYAGWDGFTDRRVMDFLEEHPPYEDELLT